MKLRPEGQLVGEEGDGSTRVRDEHVAVVFSISVLHNLRAAQLGTQAYCQGRSAGARLGRHSVRIRKRE